MVGDNALNDKVGFDNTLLVHGLGNHKNREMFIDFCSNIEPANI